MYLEELQQLEHDDKPIHVALVGIGDFGVGLAAQLRQMQGVRLVLAVDLQPERCRQGLLTAGYEHDELIPVADAATLSTTANKVVITDDSALVASSLADVVVDCTGSPEAGAVLASSAISAAKHVVMVNVEADVVVGSILRRMADKAGVVYSTADGDQPSLTAGLVQHLRALGFSIVCAGKGTALPPLDAALRRIAANPNLKRSSVAHLDGSKSQIEMACVANITGLAVDVPGFHKPRIPYLAVANTLIPRLHGGLLTESGAVDFVNCLDDQGKAPFDSHLAHGVFAIVTSSTPATMRLLQNKGCPMSRDGRYALITRPYHLCGAETPSTIVAAALHGRGTGSPLPSPVADVVAVAKKALPAGSLLDGVGGTTVRGVTYPYSQALSSGMLPLGLAEGVHLVRDIAEGEVIDYKALAEQGNGVLWRLRKEQDALCAHL